MKMSFSKYKKAKLVIPRDLFDDDIADSEEDDFNEEVLDLMKEFTLKKDKIIFDNINI